MPPGESWAEASAGEQVRDIVKGIIEGVVGVSGMYTIGMWIVCWYAGGGVGAEMARRPTRGCTAGTGITNERPSVSVSGSSAPRAFPLPLAAAFLPLTSWGR